ncbi:MAG: hypothetical protein AAB887_01260 [Patescibacteria group bacterium]
MIESRLLLVYAPLDKIKLWGAINETFQAAKADRVYTDIERITQYHQFMSLLARGLPGVDRIVAVYDKVGTAISIVNATPWTETMAITGVPNRNLCDSIRNSLVRQGVWVFGVGDGYKSGVNLEAFISGTLNFGVPL